MSTPICNYNLYHLFITGKLEIGTKLAEFCSHALLALDVLVHPRALSLERTVPSQGKTVFGAGTYQISRFGDQPQAMEAEDMYDDWLTSNNDEPPEVPVNDSAVGVSTDVMLVEDGKQLNPIAEDPKVDPPRITDAAQDAPTSTKSDVKMVDAAADETANPNTVEENPSISNVGASPECTTNFDTLKCVVFPEQVSPHENKSPAAVHPPSSSMVGTSGEPSATPGVGSSHHQAPEARSTSFAELFGSESGIESESEDSLPDIVDGDPDSD